MGRSASEKLANRPRPPLRPPHLPIPFFRLLAVAPGCLPSLRGCAYRRSPAAFGGGGDAGVFVSRFGRSRRDGDRGGVQHSERCYRALLGMLLSARGGGRRRCRIGCPRLVPKGSQVMSLFAVALTGDGPTVTADPTPVVLWDEEF